MCRPSTGEKQTVSNSEHSVQKSTLKKGDEWIENFDLRAFTEEIEELGDNLRKNQGPADVTHLNKMVGWSNAFGIVGLLTMGFYVNPISIFCLSTWTLTRWTMVAHHTCHGGYDKCHPNKKRWNRFKFGIGTFWRRLCDWFDWMMPEAWNAEHNNRHHFNLSEIHDPDLVENNLAYLREMEDPMYVKYLHVLIMASTWKWLYYSPNTYKELKLAKWRREGKRIPPGVDPSQPVSITVILAGKNPFYSASEFFFVVVGPYLLLHFFVMPMPLIFVSQYLGIEGMYMTALINLFCAEILTNLHGFLVVVTNHAGDDLYRFRHPCRPHSGSFLLRQVLASVNFAYGPDLTDFMHGYLNYQIEHHLWPSLSMLSYKKSAPLVRAICEKHGVPYVKQNVFLRLKKTIDIMVGVSSMKWFPESYEDKYLGLDTAVLAEKKAEKEAAKQARLDKRKQM